MSELSPDVDGPIPTPPPRDDNGDPGRPLPQPEDQDDHVEAAHLFATPLFGAAAAGPVMPVPVVAIGGVTVASAPNTSLTNLMVVDGLRVAWGRSGVMDQPDPQTATLTCFDPLSSWPLTADLRGQLVTISWRATRPSDGSLQTVPFFVGRITRAKLTRKIVTRDDGVKVHGLLIAMSAASILNDLANRVPAEDWPDETLGARRARIATWAANVCTGGVITRNFWSDTPHVAPVPIADQVSVLEHLLSLYESTGPDRMTFTPWNQQSCQLERRDHPTARTLAALFWNVAGEGTARDGKGAYAWSRAFPPYDNGMSSLNVYLDGARIEFGDGDGMTKDMTSMITRVEVSHPDQANANATRVEVALCSAVDSSIDEVRTGVRTARLNSIINWNAWAQLAASDLSYMAAREAGGWRPDPITIRTKVGDGAPGFEFYDQLRVILTGAETISYAFIQRSWFAQLGIRPCFALIGGTITYRAGEWRAECQLAPVNTSPAAQHAISWSEIDDGSATYQLEWHDDDNPRGLHESLTYEDIGFVGMGLGMTASPADTEGWDRIYR